MMRPAADMRGWHTWLRDPRPAGADMPTIGIKKATPVAEGQIKHQIALAAGRTRRADARFRAPAAGRPGPKDDIQVLR